MEPIRNTHHIEAERNFKAEDGGRPHIYVREEALQRFEKTCLLTILAYRLY
jgi:hypothetical protein